MRRELFVILLKVFHVSHMESESVLYSLSSNINKDLSVLLCVFLSYLTNNSWDELRTIEVCVCVCFCLCCLQVISPAPFIKVTLKLKVAYSSKTVSPNTLVILGSYYHNNPCSRVNFPVWVNSNYSLFYTHWPPQAFIFISNIKKMIFIYFIFKWNVH